MKPLLRLLALTAGLLTVTNLPAENKADAPAEKTTPAASATGIWHLQVDTAQGSGTPSFTFKQQGETLSGRYQGLFGEAPVTGTLKGTAITFSIKVNVQGEKMTITYSGTIEGDTMKGKVDFGGTGDGSFTGTRSAS